MSQPPFAMEPALSALYDRCLAAADWCVRRRRLLLFVGSPIFTLLVAAVGHYVLLGFPNSGDEYAYLYQARTFAEGRLWNAAPPMPDRFAFNYIVDEAGREFSSFPLGWPLLLAAALAAHVPAWLVNPALGTITLWLVAMLGARLHDARTGVLAAGLMAMSGFFLFNAASYFSHTFCGALLLGAAVLAAREDRRPAWVPLGIGFLIGWAVLARYYTGVVCALPIGALLLRRGVPPWRMAALVALGGLPWVAVLMGYNQAVNGSPWDLTTLPTTVGLWFARNFLLRGADILSTQMLRFVLWTPLLLLFVYFYFLARGDRSVRRGPIDWMPLLMAASLYCYVERGGNQYGPRFYYETFAFLAVFTTAHLFRHATFAEKPRGERRAFALMAASVLVMPISFLIHAAIEHRVVFERTDPYAAAVGLAPAIVLVRGRVGTARSMGPRDLTRNGLTHDGPVLFGLDLDEADPCDLRAAYPDRALYRYTWDAASRLGTIAPIACR